MKEFLKIFSDKEITETYKCIEEFIIYIEHQKIGIKIKKSKYGKYHHSCSHNYHGSEQAGSYMSSICIANSKKEAYMNAHSELLSFYNANDDHKKWVKNSYY